MKGKGLTSVSSKQQTTSKTHSFIRFAAVGGVSTILNYAIFFALVMLFPAAYLWCSAAGYVAGVGIGFFLNRRWTFDSRSPHYKIELVKYFITYACSLAIGLIVLKSLVSLLGISVLFANIITIGITMITNYVGCTVFVFKDRRKKDAVTFSGLIREHAPLVIATLIFIALFLVLYSNYGSGDQTQFLPSVYHTLDKSLYANDWYTTTNQGYNVRFFFDELVEVGIRLVGNVAVMFFLTTALLFIGTGVCLYFLAEYFMQDKRRAALFAVFFITTLNTKFIGGIHILSGELTANTVAWFFALAAYNIILRKRVIIGFFILGFATLFQPVVGCIAFALAYAMVLWNTWTDEKTLFSRKALTRLIAPASFAIISLVNIIPILLFSTGDVSNAAITYIVAIFRHPWHSYPSSWGLLHFAATGIFFILFAVLYRRSQRREKQSILASVLMSILIAIAGYVFVEIIPISIVAKAQLFRVLALASLLMYIIVFDAIMDDFTKQRSVYERIIAFALLSCFIVPYAYVPVGIIYLIATCVRESRSRSIRKYTAPIIVIAGVLGALVSATLVITKSALLPRAVIGSLPAVLSFVQGIGLSLVSLWVILCICTIMFAFKPANQAGKAHIGRKLLVAASICIVLLLVCVNLVSNPIEQRSAYPSTMMPVCTFMQAHTPTDTVFLTPPYDDYWRLCLERPIVVDYKDIAFNDKDTIVWYERLLDVTHHELTPYDKHATGFTIDLNSNYMHLDEPALLGLQAKYNFTYAVFSSNKTLAYPIAYQDANYIVYQMPART